MFLSSFLFSLTGAEKVDRVNKEGKRKYWKREQKFWSETFLRNEVSSSSSHAPAFTLRDSGSIVSLSFLHPKIESTFKRFLCWFIQLMRMKMLHRMREKKEAENEVIPEDFYVINREKNRPYITLVLKGDSSFFQFSLSQNAISLLNECYKVFKGGKVTVGKMIRV